MTTDKPHYSERKALQAYDRAAGNILPHLAIDYHNQLGEMRQLEAVEPLLVFADATTDGAFAMRQALEFALLGKRKKTKRALREALEYKAAVRYAEESFNPEGFYELLHQHSSYHIDDARSYDLNDALDWFNQTPLDATDSFRDDDKQIYPALSLQYTYIDDDGSLRSIHIARRHAQQKSPRQLTGLPAGVRPKIQEIERQMERSALMQSFESK